MKVKSRESQWISRNIFLSEGNWNPFNTSLLITAGQAVQAAAQDWIEIILCTIRVQAKPTHWDRVESQTMHLRCAWNAIHLNYLLVSLSGVFQTPSRLSLLQLCLTAIIVRLCEKRQFRKYHKAIIALPKRAWNMSEMYVWTCFEVSPCFLFLWFRIAACT